MVARKNIKIRRKKENEWCTANDDKFLAKRGEKEG
jgi:hypothetical protein